MQIKIFVAEIFCDILLKIMIVLSILETKMLFWCQQNTRKFVIHKRVYVVIFKITLLTYFAKKTLTSMRSIFRLRLLMTTSQAFVMHHLSIHISPHFVDNVTQSCLMFSSVTHSIGNVILLVLKQNPCASYIVYTNTTPW